VLLLHIVVSTVLRHVLPDTKQLLQLSKMVDQTRISSLLIRHRYAIYGYIFACLRNHADAEDVFQEVSVVTVSSHAQLLDEDGFLPWARETSLSEPESSSSRMLALRSCLDRLPETSRTAIISRYDGNCQSVEDVASMIGRTLQATYGILKRVRISLRQCVETRLESGVAQ